MTALAPVLEAFFTDRLMAQAHASGHTVAAYRDAFRLLLGFAHERLGIEPSRLALSDLDATLIGAFLVHLETERHNGAATRNARMAAIRSFYRYASFRQPEHAALIQQVLAIPDKRRARTIVSYLSRAEADALLQAPDREAAIGRRDHALVATMLQAGLRVSEATALTCNDVVLGAGAHVRVHGKGRKERATPLTRHTASVLKVWLGERDGGGEDPVFPSVRGGRLSRDAVGDLVAKHVRAAGGRFPSLLEKGVTPHTLRHTCAMRLLEAGVDTSVIALWLGHEHTKTTQLYLHGDLSMKERALARTTPAGTPVGRYRPPDRLMAFLKEL